MFIEVPNFFKIFFNAGTLKKIHILAAVLQCVILNDFKSTRKNRLYFFFTIS